MQWSGQAKVVCTNNGKLAIIWKIVAFSIIYVVRDLFPWEMFIEMVISCLLNVEKNLKLGTNRLKLDFKLLMKICFRRNNIHWEIDQWNRRRFGAKWLVTVPNSVAPVKPIVCKLIYMSRGLCCQITHKLLVCSISIRIFVKLWFWAIFIKFVTKRCSFLSFITTRVKCIIWNQHILVNVHVA